MKPKHYYEINERKICYYCANNDAVDKEHSIEHWCHLYRFECSPIGNCYDWEKAK